MCTVSAYTPQFQDGVRGLEEHLSADVKWLQESSAWHSTACQGLKPMLISNCLSNIYLITSDFSQHAPQQHQNNGMKQRQVHVLLRWLRLWWMGRSESSRMRESLCNHLVTWICIGTVAFRKPYKYPLPAISCQILHWMAMDEEMLSAFDCLFLPQRVCLCYESLWTSSQFLGSQNRFTCKK